MAVSIQEQRSLLSDLICASPAMMKALHAAQELNLSSWCIGAGVIRTLVWDHLHGLKRVSPIADIDLAYFDSAALPGENEKQISSQLLKRCPEFEWDVCNQANVHHWYAKIHANQVPPLSSLEEAIATWPEFATCVAVYLDSHDSLHIIAPYGLDDLFNMIVRRNPLRVDPLIFRERLRRKQFCNYWPKVTILDA